MIHPTAIIHPQASLDITVQVGPYAVIDADVVVGPHCWIGPHVHLTGHTEIGSHNRFHSGCVIGDAPQDLRYKNEPTRLRIGSHNVIREHVTVHRSNRVDEPTIVGSQNLLMAHSHVGHNARLGDRVIIVNGALLGGHVVIEDAAFISGHCLLHQYVRVGTLALMQGRSGISKDLPPYTVACGINGICGLNLVGLRRAGFTEAQRVELKRLYHALFRGGATLRAAIAAARLEFFDENSLRMIEFVAEAKRGVCADVGIRDESIE